MLSPGSKSKSDRTGHIASSLAYVSMLLSSHTQSYSIAPKVSNSYLHLYFVPTKFLKTSLCPLEDMIILISWSVLMLVKVNFMLFLKAAHCHHIEKEGLELSASVCSGQSLLMQWIGELKVFVIPTARRRAIDRWLDFLWFKEQATWNQTGSVIVLTLALSKRRFICGN